MLRTFCISLFTLMLLLMVGCSSENVTQPMQSGETAITEADKGRNSPGIIPAKAHPHGKTYSEWSIMAWQWLASAPNEFSPGLDETGEYMGYGQTGSVWFLTSNFTGEETIRTGVIPTGKMLFVSLIAFEASTREGYGETEEELRAVAAGVIDLVTDLSCEIDGVPVQGVDLFRFQSSEMFSLTVPEDNVFDLWGVDTPAGTYYPSVADGYYLMLPPLSAGEHIIHWSASLAEFGYFPDITYNITVGGAD